MIHELFSLSPALRNAGAQAEEDCREAFSRIEQTAARNTQKVLYSFLENGVSESHFTGSTGYGYDDRGREILDQVYAHAFGAEDALVRHHFVSGTHALTVALFGVLRPGDRLLAVAGKPYDTLGDVIGLSGEGQGSLKYFGVSYGQLERLENGTPYYPAIAQEAKNAKVAYIQRSRGYALRPSLDIATIGAIVRTVREANPKAIVMVDNCYGEFVEEQEPTGVGADLIVGSLIKNPGGGIAKTGGYIAGRKEYVQQCAYRLTSPGAGKEVGCTLGESRGMFQGFFFAPHVVGQAVKTAVFAARLFQLLGYEVYPTYDQPRTDIIQAVTLGSAEGLIAFCQGMQKGAPVDSFVVPEPWDMPGYQSQVIMAAGAFTLGSSIELSADGPVRPPYAAWMQGGLIYEAAKMGVLLGAQSLLDSGK